MSTNDVKDKAAAAQATPDAAGRGDVTASGADAQPPVSDGQTAILNDAIEIDPGRRLPHLDQGPVQAFAARGRGDLGQLDYYALVCEHHLIPRMRLASNAAAISNPSFVRLIASGVCYWPPSHSERYVFVYQNNLGKPIVPSGYVEGLGWHQETVMRTVIKPMVAVLSDLSDSDIYHGNIRPSNLFDGGMKAFERVILGECLALPPSYAQPVLYEAPERAMTDPIGRGRGLFSDDLYSFGATLAVILRHKDPLEKLSDREIIQAKIDMGSYSALTGRDRFTGAILELLRGLLYDDPAQRWTLNEVFAWLDGQRLSPKQSVRKVKSARPLHFNDERYFRPTILAMDMNVNQSEAVQLIESGAMDQWIERSLEDKMTMNRFEQAVEAAQDAGRGPGYTDRLLSRVSIALDPDAPIRYKGMSLLPEGISMALAQAFSKKVDLQLFIDIINQQLVLFWLSVQVNMHSDVSALMTRFDSCRAFLRQQTIGYGVERCLYFLCAEAPCMSDALKGLYVRNPEDLMLAFEKMASRPNRPHMFIDRHIGAFLSVKDRQVIDPFLIDLNAAEFHRRVMANIKVLAMIQKRSRMDAMPGIAGWAAEIVKPVYERYHDRELRVKLQAKVLKAAEAGDLGRMAGLLDNIEMRQQDFNDFKRAMTEYSHLRDELGEIEDKLKKPEIFARETGQEYAAIASAIIAGIIIIAVVFLYLINGGIM